MTKLSTKHHTSSDMVVVIGFQKVVCFSIYTDTIISKVIRSLPDCQQENKTHQNNEHRSSQCKGST